MPKSRSMLSEIQKSELIVCIFGELVWLSFVVEAREIKIEILSFKDPVSSRARA